MKETLKNKKGITLIALVITIIVLLILAGISIATLTGENGILTQADNAKNKSESAKIKEMLSLAWTDCQSEYSVNDSTQSKKDFITTDLLNKKISEGTISDFEYNEDKPSTLVYTSKNGDKYYVEISDEITILQDNSSMEDLKDWNGCTSCSKEHPHIITNKYEFESIRTHVNTDENGNQYIGGYFVLGNDIYFNASDFKENGDFYNNGIGFITFGIDGGSNGFNGPYTKSKIYLNGDNHIIKNLKSNYQESLQYRTGLFAYLDAGGVIENLKIDSFYLYAPTCEGLIARTIEKGAEVRNVSISNSEVNAWKNQGDMQQGGFISGVINGNVENINVENCVFKANGYFSGMIASGIGENASINGVNINNSKASSYVESGLLAFQVSKNAHFNNINIQNTAYTYTHSDIKRSGILVNKVFATSDEEIPILENSNIDIIYNGTVRTLVTSGAFKIKNSSIEIIHNEKKDNMEITGGEDTTLENSKIVYGYLENNEKVLINN